MNGEVGVRAADENEKRRCVEVEVEVCVRVGEGSSVCDFLGDDCHGDAGLPSRMIVFSFREKIRCRCRCVVGAMRGGRMDRE